MIEWNKYKLSEIAELIMGQSPPSSSYVNFGQGVPFIQGRSDFKDMYVTPTIATVSPTKIAPRDSILISVRAPVGDVNISKEEICIGRGIASIIPRALVDKTYLFYYLKSKKEEINDLGYGSIFKAINKSQLQEVEVQLPTLKHQYNIRFILTKVNAKKELLTNKLTLYKQLKQSLLEKLFNYDFTLPESEGSLPKDWELKRIGDVVDIVKKNNLKISENTIPFIPMSLISDDSLYCQNYELRSKKDIASGTYFENKSLLVSKITPCFENGKQGIAEIPTEYGITSTEIIPLKAKSDEFNIKYLHYLLSEKNRRAYLASTMEGTTGRQRLKTNVLFDLYIPVAPIKEQNNIVDLLESIDHKVDLVKGKINLYNNLFNSLLQKLMNQEIDVSNLEIENVE